MPPRYAYWTIIAGGLPTAFRAVDRNDLLPTFARIKQKHPDAEMKWFARGRLWESPESARHDADLQRRARSEAIRRPRGDRDRSGPAKPARRPGGEARARDWRPGGEHRDPRQKYKDAKKARNVDRRRQKFDRKQRSDEKRVDVRRDGRPPQRFESQSFSRNQGTEEPQKPLRPAGPNREPRPRDGREPTPPPRPTGPAFKDTKKAPNVDWRGQKFDRKQRFDEKPADVRRDGGPPRPAGPNREPRPRDGREPTPPPRPTGPAFKDAKKAPNVDWRGQKFDRKQRFDEKPADVRRDSRPPRRFESRSFNRNQGTAEPQNPPRPAGPNREPRPKEGHEPTRPPRPTGPATPPPGPPERGRPNRPGKRGRFSR